MLEDALRRRAAEAGERLTQAAEEDSLESRLELVDREHRAVRELADRRADRARPGPAQGGGYVNHDDVSAETGEEPASETPSAAEKPETKSAATMLLEIAEELYEFAVSDAGETFGGPASGRG